MNNPHEAAARIARLIQTSMKCLAEAHEVAEVTGLTNDAEHLNFHLQGLANGPQPKRLRQVRAAA